MVHDRLPIRSDQSLSRVRLFATPWIAARQASLSIINSRSSLRLTSIELVMPSSHLILCRPLLLPPIPPSIRVFSNESTLRMRWPKDWSFSFSIIPSKEYPGLISCRMDWLDLLPIGLSIDWGQWCGQTSYLDISWIQRPTPQRRCLLDTSSHDSGCRTYLPPHDPWPPSPTQLHTGHPHSQSQKWTRSRSLVPSQEHTSQSLQPPRSLSAPTGVGGWREVQCGQVSFHEFWQGRNSVHKCPPT